jgi:leader peptidase (prepilin peptidase)/N-methyltransferase
MAQRAAAIATSVLCGARVFRLVYSNARMIRIPLTVFAGLAGLAFGSFLNVCLSRWPAGESVVHPRSHCRACGRTLKWWENVPLVSWLALGGRCGTCRVQIGWRYPMVELAVGTLWAAIVWQIAWWHAGISFSPLGLIEAAAPTIGKILLVWILVGLAALDAEHLWLPDIVTLPGIVLGLVVSLMRGDFLVASSLGLTSGEPSAPFSLLNQMLRVAFAILIAAGLVLAIRWIYWLVRRREGIGLGDAKLMAMLAAWLGLPGALLAFAIGVVLGALVGIVLILRPQTGEGAATTGLTKLPLGTFLCIGGIVSALWGSEILRAYLRWAGIL